MATNVISLPTRPVVDEAWRKYSTLMQRAWTEPVWNSDPEFTAELLQAEAEYLRLYQQWAKS